MKVFPSIALVSVLAVVPTAGAQTAPDPVSADPVVHNVLLDNEHVRVFDARAARGARSPKHSHTPFVFISLDRARVRQTLADGKTSLIDTHPGQVMWMGDPIEHSWEMLSGNLHVIGVEIKSAQTGKVPPPVVRRDDDSTTVDPAVHRVLFENEHVRVFDAQAAAGMKSPLHSHPPSLLVMLAAGRGRVSQPDGNAMIVNYDPGRVLWVAEGMHHSWEMLAGEPHVIVIEPKSAQVPAAK